MARPRFMTQPAIGTTPPVYPAALPTQRIHPLEAHITKANRQQVPFELPVAAFMSAKFREQERHDAARKQQQRAGKTLSKAEILEQQAKWEQECRDHQVMRDYRHHFTDMRGRNTVKRDNIVVRK